MHAERNHRDRACPRATWRPVVAVALLAWALAAGAAELDRRQPATIEADRAEMDRGAGESRYFGDVVFVQGSLRLTGDTLTIHTREGVVRRAEATGEPARVRQETEDGRIVRAHGRTIDYDAAEGLVVLTGDAELLRDGERFAAGKIRYWPDTRRVEGGRGEDGERVRIRIEPEQQDSATGGDAGAGNGGADAQSGGSDGGGGGEAPAGEGS